MTLSRLLAGLGLLALGIGAIALGFRNPKPVQLPPDTVYQKVTERSAAVVDTVTKVVTFFKTRIDTLPGDTVYVPKVILREVVRACELCAEQLRVHKRVADSVIQANRDTIASLRAQLSSCKARRSWYAAGGATLSALACGLSR